MPMTPAASVNISSRLSGIQVLMGSPPVYTDIPQTAGLDGPGPAPAFDDVTSTTSPDNWDETVATTKSPGKVTTTLIWNPANAAHQYLLDSSLSADSPLEHFKELLGPGPSKTLSYTAFVSLFKFQPAIKKQIRVSLELTLSGPITVA